jgi:NAD+ diphosphatase
MLHHIEPHIFNNTFIENAPEHADDYILCYKENSILLVQKESELVIPRRSDFDEVFPEDVTHYYLFSLDGVHCFLINEFKWNNPDFVFYEHMILRTLAARELAYIGAVGFHLYKWVDEHRFCSRCGTKTTYKKSERAVYCPACELTVYPKISPAVIVAITCKDKILLAKGKHYRFNFYSLVAGYADIGESLEQTVIREVKEEVGIEIRNLRYYGSQPWPFSSSMMIGYFAEADDQQPIVVDTKELHDAQWFSRDNLPETPGNISIAGEMIELFRSGKMDSL